MAVNVIANILNKVVDYGKDFFAYERYLSEFSNILHSKKKFDQSLDEDDVLLLNSELNDFFANNITVKIVIDLKTQYEYCKKVAKEQTEKSKKQCIERNRKKLESQLDTAKFLKNDKGIDTIEYKLETLTFCPNHGLDEYFYEYVIIPMDEYIKEIRIKNF